MLGGDRRWLWVSWGSFWCKVDGLGERSDGDTRFFPLAYYSVPLDFVYVIYLYL
jgi:hypothetical protein